MFIYLFEREITDFLRPIGVKFRTMITSRLNFIMPVYFLIKQSLSEKKLEAKTCKILCDFDDFKFGEQISRK